MITNTLGICSNPFIYSDFLHFYSANSLVFNIFAPSCTNRVSYVYSKSACKL